MFGSKESHAAEEGRKLREPALIKAIEGCHRDGDASCRAAIEHWLACVRSRVALRPPHTLKLPDVLRKALGLDSQEVRILENGQLWSIVKTRHFIERGGRKIPVRHWRTCLLLYTPNVSSS